VQINLTIPSNVPTGCWVPIIAIAGGVASNTVTLPINNGGGACIDAIDGLTGDQFSPTQGGQTLRTGLAVLLHLVDAATTPGVTDSTDGAFVKYTGLYVPPNSLSPGACIVGVPVIYPQPSLTFLKAGQITLTGPNGLSVNPGPAIGITGTFYSLLKSGDVVPGTYTFTGAGGADVGPFTASVTLADPLLKLTLPTTNTVDRSKPFTVTWSGGNPGTYVYISGSSTSLPLGVIVFFKCLVSVSAGQFTVPSYILQALPPGKGGINVQNTFFTPFTATGLDAASVGATVSYSGIAATFQ
jgi:hypothetical protein